MKKANYKLMIDQKIKFNAERGYESFILRPILKVGRGRYSQYSKDHSDQYKKYLRELGLEFKEGNDAPKGGRLGDFIEVFINDAMREKYPLIKRIPKRLPIIFKEDSPEFEEIEFDKNIKKISNYDLKARDELITYLKVELNKYCWDKIFDNAVFTSSSDIEGYYFPNFKDKLKCIAFINGRAVCVVR